MTTYAGIVGAITVGLLVGVILCVAISFIFPATSEQ